MNILSTAVFSIIVRTFMACLVTMRWLALLGSGAYVVGAFGVRWGRDDFIGVSIFTLLMGGTKPGVLFLVLRRCDLVVCLRIRLDVGFLACIIGSVFVIRGSVMIGVSSITLCCRSVSNSPGDVIATLSIFLRFA